MKAPAVVNTVSSGTSNEFIISLIFYLAILIVIFLLARQFALWYWKIDHAIELLKSIEENTRKDKK